MNTLNLFWWYYLFGESALALKLVEVDSCIFLVAANDSCTQQLVQVDSCI